MKTNSSIQIEENQPGVSRSLCKKELPFLHKIKSFQSKSDSNVSSTCPNPR